MINLTNIAIIGSGPTALYLMKYILSHVSILKQEIQTITIFEKESTLGMGMPYRPKTTDIYNLANISSEEIPLLTITFADWLRQQNVETLAKLNIGDAKINDAEVYNRVALGSYFEHQFQQLIQSIECSGIKVVRNAESEVVDIIRRDNSEVSIITANGNSYNYTTTIIANGHEWKEKDVQEVGYYASPWPIHKLFPKKNQSYNFLIGILGSSLSAFDVVTSLSHRHGSFSKVNGALKYTKNAENPKFQIVLHSAAGWLPHLQYEQQKPIREIYRHFKKIQLLDLINEQGFLRIENYFDKLCRPALIKAFTKDKLIEIAEMLKERSFTFANLVEVMAERHIYTNSFEGMRLEMHTAKNSVYNKIPIYWMETLDDLMYSLNYHAELLPAEDHIFFHKEIMSFLMNVIAALPLQSAEILLALYDAQTVSLKTGRVTNIQHVTTESQTEVEIEKENGEAETIKYQLFVNCGGGKKLELDKYPFKSLVAHGDVVNATAVFADNQIANESKIELVTLNKDNQQSLKLSGIAINGSYNTINATGATNNNIYDINFTHTGGLRPYSYGLQACSATSLIVVESWITNIQQGGEIGNNIDELTQLYEENDEL
ncbi:FAD/NAD(P)-binding protein [Flavobacterium tegetincola]|uniref:FAD/NAD(P)-binding protein n=1 Tax=Flavobacterium tegetincola TaxID=150172 RepID=UPI0003FAE30F|nr:FAD/NAD(P)-binding protein [Flavobacterium tegetincola]